MASSLPPAFGEAFKAIVLRELREEIEAGNLLHSVPDPCPQVRRTPPPPWVLIAMEWSP